MILGYRNLIKLWKDGKVQFSPNIEERSIGLSSIDLRLGYSFTKHKDLSGVQVDPLDEGFEPANLTETTDFSQQTLPSGQTHMFILKPREFVLARTLEEVRLPRDLCAQVQGVTTGARAGLTVHATAPHIHPAFRGSITLELANFGSWNITLRPEMRICQLILFQVSPPVSQAEVDALSSYLGQLTPYPKRKIGSKSEAKKRTK